MNVRICRKFSRRVQTGAAVAALAAACVGLSTNAAHASLTNSFQFNGKGNWSIDAVGSNSTPVGSIDALVPAGSAVVKAFLYSSTFTGGTPTVGFDGTIINPADFTVFGNNGSLRAYRADVTSQVSAKVGGGGGTFSFQIDSETSNTSIDGEVLAVIYSNPLETERTIAFLDGFSLSSGDTTTFNFSSPLGDPTAPGFEALMSLGIGFGFQGTGQFSNVDVNGRRLTSSAGGSDDGIATNGGLITAGGLGDDPLNPVNPLAGPTNPRSDDELYNLALGNGVDANPFLSMGLNSFTVDTRNPSGDDNIFFLGLNVTARGGVNQPPPPSAVPEPTSLALLGMGALGLVTRRRRNR